MKVLVTGAGGQLGRELVEVCEAAGDDAIAAPTLRIDDRDQALTWITELQPDVVVNAAAWTDVDGCEADPDRAFAANALGVRWVAEGCRRAGAHLVHISTDYVFDGATDGSYDEWAEPSPRSVYGRSKLAGEREASAGVEGAAIVRTSWLSGRHGRNMVRTVLGLADDPARSLAFVDDQLGHPTFCADLAPMLRRLAIARVPGTFHVTNQGVTSWYGFARAVLEAAGHDPDRVRPITTADLEPPRLAARPPRSVLANRAVLGLGWDLLPHFSAPLSQLVAQLRTTTSTS